MYLRGGGVQPQFIVKLVFVLAVDQQTRTSDKTFEGVLDPQPPTAVAVWPRPYLVYFCPIMQHHRNMPRTHILDTLLVAIGRLNSYMDFHPY